MHHIIIISSEILKVLKLDFDTGATHTELFLLSSNKSAFFQVRFEAHESPLYPADNPP